MVKHLKKAERIQLQLPKQLNKIWYFLMVTVANKNTFGDSVYFCISLFIYASIL